MYEDASRAAAPPSDGIQQANSPYRIHHPRNRATGLIVITAFDPSASALNEPPSDVVTPNREPLPARRPSSRELALRLLEPSAGIITVPEAEGAGCM